MTHNEILDELGGNTAVANLVGIKPPAVAYWRRKGIPPLRVIQLKTLKPETMAKLETVQAVQPTTTITSA
jgi:hypothetical protein